MAALTFERYVGAHERGDKEFHVVSMSGSMPNEASAQWLLYYTLLRNRLPSMLNPLGWRVFLERGNSGIMAGCT
eukprot:1785457-Amphidinium_carterae.1